MKSHLSCIVSLHINSFCCQSYRINPGVRLWGKIYRSLPKADQKWSYTFRSCCKRLFEPFTFRIIQSNNIWGFSNINPFWWWKSKICIWININYGSSNQVYCSCIVSRPNFFICNINTIFITNWIFLRKKWSKIVYKKSRFKSIQTIWIGNKKSCSVCFQ